MLANCQGFITLNQQLLPTANFMSMLMTNNKQFYQAQSPQTYNQIDPRPIPILLRAQSPGRIMRPSEQVIRLAQPQKRQILTMIRQANPINNNNNNKLINNDQHKLIQTREMGELPRQSATPMISIRVNPNPIGQSGSASRFNGGSAAVSQFMSPPYESQPVKAQIQMDTPRSNPSTMVTDHQVAASTTDEVHSASEMDNSQTNLDEQTQNSEQQKDQQHNSEVQAFSGSDLETMQDFGATPTQFSFGYRKQQPSDNATSDSNGPVQHQFASDEQFSGMQQLENNDNDYGTNSSSIQDEQLPQTDQDEQLQFSVQHQLSHDHGPNLTQQPSNSQALIRQQQQNQEAGNLLASQLPSQYDAIIRIPPDGYYDDYFKPGQPHTSNQQQQQIVAGSMDVNNVDTMAQMSDEEINDSTGPNSNSLIDDKNSNQELDVGQELGNINQANNDYGSKLIHNNDIKQQQQQQQQIDSDNIKLIMAETSGANSTSNNNATDKVINYTSESSKPGGNVTRFEQANKSSPRLTFVNKDMNESVVNRPNQEHWPASKAASDVTRSKESTQRLNHREDDESNYAIETQNNNENDMYAIIKAASEQDGSQLQQHQRAPLGNANKQERMHHHHHHLKPKHKYIKNKPAEPVRQVTEVRLNPNQLTLGPPTKAPEFLGGGSPVKIMESISQLPKKMKKMQEEKPDKNELMNELLTALDRVKVAIYKLQPLTAKMNAIYRKSVASNTRDMVMDNNKGFYAKRYPPGDFDDSYDRIPTREFLRRQDESTKNLTHKYLLRKRSIDSMQFLGATDDHKLTLEKSQSTEPQKSSGNQIVATGIGRRLNDHNKHLKFSENLLNVTADQSNCGSENEGIRSSERLDEILLAPKEVAAHALQTGAGEQPETDSSAEGASLFGYRITIFRPPENQRVGPEAESAFLETSQDLTGDDGQLQDLISESMLTGESNLVETRLSVDPSSRLISSNYDNTTVSSNDGSLDVSESEKSKSMKKMEARKGGEGAKKAEIKKHQEAKKADGMEKKMKREYKKIKHNKGLVSKEKNTMKRDKHIKAHDRGAAKEKALKERTQIEFFEREQIVDDEFEKGKKSSVKAGWQTGHDSKKSKKEGASIERGDISMRDSYHVKHVPEAPQKLVGHTKNDQLSSGKKSNKFENKQMEAKGKKFKGWREKGYKIITETEFIDRGSLHDSAYRKRDRGAAQHQKYKKHQASSEGHHEALHEHMKKSNKKEEKNMKKEERKEVRSKRGEKLKKKAAAEAKKSDANHRSDQGRAA